MKILCFGDVVGRPGREALAKTLGVLKAEYQADLLIVNGENAAGGLGIDAGTAAEIFKAGAHVITLGDHCFQKKEAKSLLEADKARIIRPANYPPGAPGMGYTVVTSPSGAKLGVVNMIGRVFLNLFLDCPFRTMDALLESGLKGCQAIVCDFHGEATSEKEAFAKNFDSRLSLVFGTHTHVPTADERILAGGTAFISDIGMCGSTNGVIGMDAATAIDRFRTGASRAYEVAKGNAAVQGIFCEIDESTGKAVTLTRVRREA